LLETLSNVAYFVVRLHSSTSLLENYFFFPLPHYTYTVFKYFIVFLATYFRHQASFFGNMPDEQDVIYHKLKFDTSSGQQNIHSHRMRRNPG
jgi:hypothetical protein